jgi:Gpi18-like mannosyltransferase/phage tail protein X
LTDPSLSACFPSQAPAAPKPWRLAAALMVAALLAGLALRFAFRAHVTSDATAYLAWYAYARAHGVAALREVFTDYAPFYSYLLLIAAKFDGLAEPLTLIKTISVAFELGCALVLAHIVRDATASPLRAALVFCAAWLAPTVLINGAVIGQIDSLWTFFTLAAVALFLRGRNGVPLFAVAIAAKLQAVFLGPFVFGLVLRRRVHWGWLAALPAAYLLLALPVLVAGRPFASVFAVYQGQAGLFDLLTMNAANVWVFASTTPYALGVAVGLALAGAAGLALSVFIARTDRDGPEFLLLAACLSLLLMPFLLPKMHDRYFFAFELASIALAALNPRYLPVAVVAQANGVLSLLGFVAGDHVMGILPAALCNLMLVGFLVADLARGGRGFRWVWWTWTAYAGALAGLVAAVLTAEPGWTASPAIMVASMATVFAALVLLRESRPD